METLRLPYYNLCPELTNALRSVVTQLEQNPLGVGLIELLYLRVSQMNGCTFCLSMHGRKLLDAGDTQERLDALAYWRTSNLFDAREAAALAWAESLTNIAETHAPDKDFDPLGSYFTDEEITGLTFAIVTMNALNRLAISMRRVS